MAQIGMNFDATKYEPQTGGASQLPVSDSNGWPVIISASEMKENAAKTGGYLELTFQIIDGEHRGEEGKYRLNLFHTNEQVVAIAYKQLSAICHVTGVFQVNDSAQLHNRPFRCVVKLQKDVEAAAKGYTEITYVLNSDGSQPGKGQAGAQPAPAQAPVQAPAPAPQPAPAAQAVVQPEAAAVAPAWGAAVAPAWGAPAVPAWAVKP